jgi:DNA-binding NtrC family response regulator
VEKTLGEVEQEMIQNALEVCGWKIEGDGGVATRLGVAPSTLRERIKKYGLQRRMPAVVRYLSA